LSKEPLLQSSQGNKLHLFVAGAENSPEKESLLIQELQATCASHPVDPAKKPLRPQESQGSKLHLFVAGAENSPEKESLLIQELKATCASHSVDPAKEPLRPQELQGDTLDSSGTGAENSPEKGSLLNQKLKATCAFDSVTPVRESHPGQKEPRIPSGKPRLFRPGPQRFEYPTDSLIHRNLIAAQYRLSNSAPFKSGRIYPHGTEPRDLRVAFTPPTNGGSQLIETHQLYSDLTLQIVRKNPAGFVLTTQKLASPRD
jgi:hypothetical protein